MNPTIRLITRNHNQVGLGVEWLSLMNPSPLVAPLQAPNVLVTSETIHEPWSKHIRTDAVDGGKLQLQAGLWYTNISAL